MRKQLYKSAVPKSLSVAFLSVSLFSSSILAVHANESSEESVVSQDIIETDLVENSEYLVSDELLLDDAVGSEPEFVEEVTEEISESESITEIISEEKEGINNEEVIEKNIEENEKEEIDRIPTDEEDESNLFSTNASLDSSDNTAPTLISYSTDKSVYQTGENINLTVVASDESDLGWIQASFLNTTNIGVGSLSGYASTSNITKNSDGNYETVISIEIPEKHASTTFNLNWINVEDTALNSQTYRIQDSAMLSQLSIKVENKGIEDTNAPTLISYSTDKSVYQTGENINLTVVASDESDLGWIQASFLNTTNIGVGSLSGYASTSNITKNSDGNYETVIFIEIPEKHASTTFNLNWINIEDTALNSQTYRIQDSAILSQLSIKVENKGIEDTNAPTLISYSTDKTVYKAGENINLTVVASDESDLGWIQASFLNATNIGVGSLSGYASTSNITKNSDGNYETVISIEIPEKHAATTFNLNWINLEDSALNTKTNYIYTNKSLKQLPVIISNVDAGLLVPSELESLTADKSIENVITLIEVNSGKILAKVEFYGETYDARLEEYINNFNTKNNVNYVFESTELIGEAPITITSGDRVTFSHVQYKRNVYLSNTSTNELPVIEAPFVPEGIIYSSEATENVSKDVVIKYGTQILHKYTAINTESIDETIRNAMKSINSELYYYKDVEINHSMVWRSVNGQFYNGLEKDITIHVAKRPEIKEEKSTKAVTFKTTYTESEELLKGQEELVQAGKNGILTSTSKVTYVDGIETGRELVSEVVTTKPTDRIIARGVKEIKQEQEKSVVDFKTQRVDNSDLLLGTEKASQKGVAGELTTTYEVTYIRGEETNRTKVSDVTTKEPITEIIQVGTKEVKQEVVNEAVPFETEYVQNSDLLVGESNEITAGIAGKQDVTYEVTYVKGKETSRTALSFNVLVKPVTRVLEVGSKEIKKEAIETDIPFEIEYIDSAELMVGTENVKQAGKKGTETTEFEVIYVNGKEVSRKELSKEVTTKPVTQIVEKGIREVRSEIKTEVVPFETESVNNPEMLVGETLVSQVGLAGERTITENVYFVNGDEVEREVASNEITLKPINEIIQVGVKEVKVEEFTEVVEFEIDYLDNEEWLVGAVEIITPGANGEAFVTYEITYVNGEEISRTELSRVILVAPTTQVVERGTKEPAKPVEVEKDTPTNQANNGQKTLPDTGEEKQYAIFSVAVLSILAGLGLIVPRKRKE